jgi:hypothetical protein
MRRYITDVQKEKEKVAPIKITRSVGLQVCTLRSLLSYRALSHNSVFKQCFETCWGPSLTWKLKLLSMSSKVEKHFCTMVRGLKILRTSDQDIGTYVVGLKLNYFILSSIVKTF